MKPCIICGLVNGQRPCRVVYETEQVFCFLPLGLNAYGHTVIAPKAHYATLYDIPEDTLREVAVVGKRLALHYQRAIGATGVNLLHASGVDAQQSVMHFHLHLLPRFGEDGLDAWPALPVVSVDKDTLVERLRME